MHARRLPRRLQSAVAVAMEPRSWISRWTAAEPSRFAELARDGLRADTGMRVEAIVTDDDAYLAIALDRPATLTLEPRDWRDAWVLALDEGELAPGGRLAVTRRELRAALRVRRRAIVRGDVVVPIADVAFHRYTRQSSAVAGVPAPDIAPTEPELAPWWEIDLGATMYVSRIRIRLGATHARVTVRGYGFAAPDGAPAYPTTLFDGAVAAGPTKRTDMMDGTIAIEAGAVARFVRVELAAGAPVTLAVRDIEVLAADLYADTLAGSLARAFALFARRRLCDGWTYGDVAARADAIAAGLAAFDVWGQRVTLGVMLPSSVDWIAVELAALARGHVVVAIGHDEPADRLARIAAAIALTCVVCEPANVARVAALGVPARTCDELAAAAPVPAAAPPRAPDDVYAVLFTSGSTGTPKGATRTYAQFLAMIQSYNIGHSPRHVSFQPIAHLSERMYLPALLVHGGTLAFSRGGAHVLDDLAAFGPTTIGSVPRLFEVLHARYRRRAEAIGDAEAMAEARRAFGDNVVALSVGSAPCSPEVLAFLRRCFADAWVFEGYGSTELGTIAVDGRVSDKVEVKLVPVDGGGGEEIYVRTPFLFGGYLGEAAVARDDDGFVATGDLGERDADGRVRVIGRVRNTVKLANGEFVAAERVETALATAPGVDRIYVHAVPGAHGVAAVVVGDRIELAALHAHGRAAGLADYELPRGIVVVREATVDNGLVLPSGKLARPAFAARFGEQLAAIASGSYDREPPATTTRDRVAQIASSIVGRAVDPDAPLGPGVGADSLAVAEILAALSDELGIDIPLGWWFDSASLADLASRIRGGRGEADVRALAAADRDLPVSPLPAPRPAPRTVLVTGATGFLGAHLVEALVARGRDVVALVRGPDDAAASTRLTAALARWGVAPRARAIAGDLADLHVDLTGIDAIVHAGAVVSWLASYATLRPANVLGTHALLAAAARADIPVHFVSTISTTAGDEDATLPFDAALAATPYALSKWLAEHLARAAGATIHRPAMISGHSRRGLGNPDDFVHRYLAGCLELGIAIDEPHAILDTTPVDFVADAIAELVHAGARGTFQLANPTSASYTDLARALGVPAVPYAHFRAEIARSPRLRPLASFFPPTFALGMGPFACARTDARLAELGVARPPIDLARYVAFARNIIK